MNYEFDEVAREQAEQVGAELSRIERHGGSAGEVDEAFAPLDDVIGQLESALSEAKSLKAELDGRAGEVRDEIGLVAEADSDDEGYEDYGDGPLEGPLEEQYENAEFAQDGDFANMSAEDVL